MVVRNKKSSAPANAADAAPANATADAAPATDAVATDEVVAEVATPVAKRQEEYLDGDDLLALIEAPEETVDIPIVGAKVSTNHKGTRTLWWTRNGVNFEAYPDCAENQAAGLWPAGLVVGARINATLTVRKHGGSRSKTGDDGRRYITVFFTAMALK